MVSRMRGARGHWRCFFGKFRLFGFFGEVRCKDKLCTKIRTIDFTVNDFTDESGVCACVKAASHIVFIESDGLIFSIDAIHTFGVTHAKGCIRCNLYIVSAIFANIPVDGGINNICVSINGNATT